MAPGPALHTDAHNNRLKLNLHWIRRDLTRTVHSRHRPRISMVIIDFLPFLKLGQFNGNSHMQDVLRSSCSRVTIGWNDLLHSEFKTLASNSLQPSFAISPSIHASCPLMGRSLGESVRAEGDVGRSRSGREGPNPINVQLCWFAQNFFHQAEHVGSRNFMCLVTINCCWIFMSFWIFLSQCSPP